MKKIKQITEFPDYYITVYGNIWSAKRGGHNGRWLNPGESKYGHLSVVLSKDGKQYTRRVHRLMLETFVGPCPEGMECCHNDGNPKNNLLSNLRWDTHKNNMQDAVKQGTMKKAGKSKIRANIPKNIDELKCRMMEAGFNLYQL